MKHSQGASQEWEQKNHIILHQDSFRGKCFALDLKWKSPEKLDAAFTSLLKILQESERATLGPRHHLGSFSIPPNDSHSFCLVSWPVHGLSHPSDPQLSLFHNYIYVSTWKGNISPNTETNTMVGTRGRPRALIPSPSFLPLVSSKRGITKQLLGLCICFQCPSRTLGKSGQ